MPHVNRQIQPAVSSDISHEKLLLPAWERCRRIVDGKTKGSDITDPAPAVAPADTIDTIDTTDDVLRKAS